MCVTRGSWQREFGESVGWCETKSRVGAYGGQSMREEGEGGWKSFNFFEYPFRGVGNIGQLSFRRFKCEDLLIGWCTTGMIELTPFHSIRLYIIRPPNPQFTRYVSTVM